MPRVSATALLGLFILLQASAASGQGFRSSNTPKLGVANPYIPVQHLYGPSQAWKPNYKNNPKSACSKQNPRSLCAAAINTASSEYAQLVMATSPRAYSTTNSSQSGYKNLVTPPGDQGFCQTCTAFAVTSAAETAMATALGVDAQDCSISVQALYFCPPPVKSCFAGWDLWNALNQLQQRGQELPVADCLPYTADSNGEVMESVLCSGCSTTNNYARMGNFSSKQIMSVWEAQRHIRQYGSVISKFDVYTDFKAFFANKRNAKAIYKPGPSAKVEFGHAVALVGYDNDKQFWLAKNSWGPDWADNGFFRVAYDTCAVLTPETGEAWGVKWTPTPAYAPPARTLAVTRATGQNNCFLHKAKPGDYLSRIAWLAGIGLAQFMLDNVDIVKDLDAPISGLNLKICNPMSDVPIEPGDCPGNDLKGIPDGCFANMSNVTACTQYCLSVPACKSFTFRPARTADGWCPGACWLKKGKTNQCNPDPKSNTGVVRRDVTLSVGFALENGDYKWNDLQDPDIGCKLNKASVQACAQYCQQNPACKSFTYHPAAGADGWCPNACWIKSGKTQKYNPDARYITGVRL